MPQGLFDLQVNYRYYNDRKQKDSRNKVEPIQLRKQPPQIHSAFFPIDPSHS
jgi:hypothetical protein